LYQGVEMNLTEQLGIVEGALQKLIRDWERFFAGDLRVPPHQDRDRLSRRLRLLAEDSEGSRAERFRLEQVQHRFQTYVQNWERMLREREEGRGRSVAAIRRQTGAPTAPTNVSPPPAVNEGSAAALYDRYVAAKRKSGDQVALDRATFDAQIAAKRDRLEDELGKKVRFEVLVEDGKVRLAARAAKARDTRE
jgi:hypothetical protein